MYHIYLLKLVVGITDSKLKFTWFITLQKYVVILLRISIIIMYNIPVIVCKYLHNHFGEI